MGEGAHDSPLLFLTQAKDKVTGTMQPVAKDDNMVCECPRAALNNGPPEGTGPANTLTLTLGEWFGPSGLKNSKRINVCYFKPTSLW